MSGFSATMRRHLEAPGLPAIGRSALMAAALLLGACSTAREAPPQPEPHPAWIRHADGWLSPRAPGSAVAAVGPGGDRFRLTDPASGVALEVVPEHGGAGRVVLDATGGARVEASGGGPALSYRFREGGIEDFARFEDAAPPPRSVAYRVHLGERVAGLRQVGSVLEFLDAGGAPRLRVQAPWLSDRAGRRHVPELGVQGCRVDRDPRAPWGRRPEPPGARTCRVRVKWPSTLEVALLDPVWTRTESMSVGRGGHGAVLLDTGRVLVVGGVTRMIDVSQGLHRTAELFDPESGTWAATGELTVGPGTPRRRTAKLTDGRVLVVHREAADGAEIYDPSTGEWTQTEPLVEDRGGDCTVTALPDGGALVVGGKGESGLLASAERFDPGAGAFSPTGALDAPRANHHAVLLGSGEVLVFGGEPLDGLNAYPKLSELYDPSAGTFAPAGELVFGRQGGAAALLDDGRVLTVGGCACVGGTDEIYDPGTDTWTALRPATSQDLRGFTLIPLPGGRAMAAGGFAFGVRDEVFVFDGGERWLEAAPMSTIRTGHSATPLPDGSVLVAGGRTSDRDTTPQGSAEIYRQLELGEACTRAADCESGFCSDEVCCDAPSCSGPCRACRRAAGAAEDGLCTAFSQQTRCRAAACDGARFQPEAFCDGEGACAVPEAEDCGRLVCGDDGCKTSCAEDGDCRSSYVCAAGACKTPEGRTCDADADCAGGHCDNGVCCADPPCGAMEGGPEPPCEADEDCPTGWICALQKCRAPTLGSEGSAGAGSAPAPGGGSGGCGCRTAGSDPPRPFPGLLLLAALAAAAARRRRRG